MNIHNEQSGTQPCWQHLLPEFAPLSATFVQFLFEHSERFDLPTYDTDATLLDRIWANVQLTRGKVYNSVQPIVLAKRSGTLDNRLSIRWFHTVMKRFDPLQKDSSRQKFANWQIRGLLRMKEFGLPDPNSAASLLLMRTLSSQRRGWLPSYIDVNEPWFWVWGQQPGGALPQIYPLPLPSDLPANTLLWSSWIGAAWLPGWKHIRKEGAIAWAKTVQVREQTMWHLSEEELAIWDYDFVAQAHLAKYERISLPGLRMAHEVEDETYTLARLHALADELLFRVGEPLFYQHLTQYYSAGISF